MPEPATTQCSDRVLWLSPVGRADYAHYVRICDCHFWQRVENVAAIGLAAELRRQRQNVATRKARQRNRAGAR